jgi:hypothetical protein
MTGEDPALTRALAPLVALDPTEVVPLPPRRIPLPGGRECLIEWRQEPQSDRWKLELIARPVATDDRDTAIASFAASIALGARTACTEWHGAEPAFADWVNANLGHVVAETVAALPTERIALRNRAGIRGRADGKTSVADFMPHMLIAGALVAFVYMFIVVNLN